MMSKCGRSFSFWGLRPWTPLRPPDLLLTPYKKNPAGAHADKSVPTVGRDKPRANKQVENFMTLVTLFGEGIKDDRIG